MEGRGTRGRSKCVGLCVGEGTRGRSKCVGLCVGEGN